MESTGSPRHPFTETLDGRLAGRIRDVRYVSNDHDRQGVFPVQGTGIVGGGNGKVISSENGAGPWPFTDFFPTVSLGRCPRLV